MEERLAREEPPSSLRSSDWVARMPSVSQVRTISSPGVSTGIPLKKTMCGPSSGCSSRAHVVKCVATSDSVKKILRPSRRKPSAVGVAIVAQSSSAPPNPASDVHEAKITSRSTTRRRKPSARASPVRLHSAVNEEQVVRCMFTASAVAPSPWASRSCASRNSYGSASKPPSSAGTVSAR